MINMGVKMDGNIHESFMAYLRHLISTKQLDADIPADIKPIVIAYFFNMEVFRGGIQCFFEGYTFRLEEVLSAFRLLGVDPELISVVEEAGMHEYLSDDDIYECLKYHRPHLLGSRQEHFMYLAGDFGPGIKTGQDNTRNLQRLIGMATSRLNRGIEL